MQTVTGNVSLLHSFILEGTLSYQDIAVRDIES